MTYDVQKWQASINYMYPINDETPQHAGRMVVVLAAEAEAHEKAAIEATQVAERALAASRIEDLRREAFDEGRTKSDGYKVGHYIGYGEGHKIGYDIGHSEGREQTILDCIKVLETEWGSSWCGIDYASCDDYEHPCRERKKQIARLVDVIRRRFNDAIAEGFVERIT